MSALLSELNGKTELLDFADVKANKERSSENDLFVRVRTSYYSSDKGYVEKRIMTILKRKSAHGMIECFDNDMSMMGWDYWLPSIFAEMKEDGLYQIFCHWLPGSWEDPQDGDVEWKVEKVEE